MVIAPAHCHRARFILLSAFLMLLLPAAVFAAGAKNWTGTVNSSMNNASNWFENAVPVTGDDLIFGSASSFTVNNDLAAGTSFKSITFNGAAYTISGNMLKLSGGPFAIQNTGGNHTISLDIVFETGAPTISTGNTSSLTITGNIDNGGFDITLSPANPSGVINLHGIVSGAGGLILQGGAVHLGGSFANTYTGATQVNAGMLELTKPAGTDCFAGNLLIGDGSGGINADVVRLLSSDQIPNGALVSIGGSGQLDLQNFNETLTIAGSNTGNIALGGTSASILTLVGAGNAVFGGQITGNGNAIVKNGGGTFAITSAQTFSAAIKVVNGTLEVSGGGMLPASAPIELENPGVLTGDGAVAAVSSGSPSPKGGKIATGTAPGATAKFTTGNISLDDSATVEIDINGNAAGSQYDQIKVIGSVSLNNPVLSVNATFAPLVSDTFLIIDNDSTDPVTGTFFNLPEGAKFDASGFTFQINYNAGDGNDVVLTRVPMDTTTGLISSQNPEDPNVNVTFTATVSAASGTPTGTIQFKNGGVPMGSAVAMVNGSATSAPVSFPSPGTQTITAEYSGDAHFNPSTSSAVNQIVRAHITSSLSVTAPANSAFSYSITADNTPTLFSATGLPASLTLNTSTGDITGTPTNSDLNSYQVSLQAMGSSGTASGTLTLIIDSAPSASGQAVFGSEDTPLPITVSASDIDPQSLTYIIISPPTGGVLSGTGPNFTYTPNKDFFGTDHFHFKANDGILDSNGAQVDVNIAPSNDPPAASDGARATPMGTPLNATLSASDPDSPSIVFSIVSNGSKGTATINNTSTGDFTYVPNPGVTGVDSFTFKANDGSVDSNIATFTVTIAGVAPVITSATSATGVVGQDFNYAITANGTVPIIYSATVLPGGLFLNGSTIGGVPTESGVTDVMLTASNGTHPDDTIKLTIVIASEPIRIVSPASALGKVGLGFSYEIEAEGDGPFTFTAEGLPEGLIFDDSTISGTPKAEGTFTITLGASDVDGLSTSLSLQLEIKDKNFDLPPTVSEIEGDPLPPSPGDPVEFFVEAEDPEGADLTISWDFGDGSSSAGEDVEHVYSVAGVYTVTANVSDGSNTVTKTLSVHVQALDPNAPSISAVSISANPAHTGDTLTFTATASDPNNDALTITWNFGDGSPLTTGASVQHSYANLGDYTVTVTVLDATGLSGRAVSRDMFVVDPAGTENVNSGSTAVNPLNGLGIKVASSSDGVIQLAIDVDALNRDAFAVDTNFGLPGRASEKGTQPVVKFEKPAIYVATTTARDTTTREVKGKARKTLPISAKETHTKSKITAPPPTKTIVVSAIKGSFLFGRSGGATKPTSKPDLVTLSGSITLPEGISLAEPQEVHVAVGNVVDKMVLDAKGKGAGKFSKLGLKAAKKGSKDAKFSVQMRLADMTGQGFDTEGVNPKPKSNALKIQCALLVGGETYAIDTPVQLKVDSKGAKGQISGRGSRGE
jgi:autotransporter-associated beta strand protein